jgi:hypothetical protein
MMPVDSGDHASRVGRSTMPTTTSPTLVPLRPVFSSAPTALSASCVVHRRPCTPVDDGTGRVRIPVATVRASGEDGDAVAALSLGVKRVRRRERELLAPAARNRFPCAESNGRLAAPQHAAERGVGAGSVLVGQSRLTKPHELIDESLRGERRVIEQRLRDDLDR